MAQTIKLKRSATAGNIPTSSDLALGEIAINTADGAVYIKKGNDDIVAVADNDILHIDTTNSRVGIGTTSPSSRLNVVHSSNATNGIIVQNATVGTSARSVIRLLSDAAQFDMYATSSTYSGVASWSDSGVLSTSSNASGGLVLNAQAGGIKFQDATTEIMRISDGGNVGIGTTSPSQSKLVVDGTISIPRSERFQFLESISGTFRAGIFSTNTNDTGVGFNSLRFFVNSDSTNPAMVIGGSTNTKNVGIGLQNPSEKLHIYGTGATISGKVEAGDGNQASLDLKNSEGEFRLISDGGELYVYDQTDAAERFRIDTSGAIKFNNAYTFPTADGSANQVLRTDGSGNLSFATVSGGGGSSNSITDADGDTKIQVEESADEDIIRFDVAGTEVLQLTSDGLVLSTTDVEANEFIGDLRGAVLFKAQAGENVTKGDVVYISGISGNTTVVSKADADDASKMPAFGIVATTTTSGQPVDIYTQGILGSLDTSAYSEGDELFVSTTAGALTNTPPTGETAAIQKIAKVTRSNASAGSIFITGAGRSNATPNLDEDQFFLGNASNQAVATDFSDAVEALSINNVVEDTTPQLGGDLASNGNDILFGDNDKAVFGAGSDLQIYSDGSSSKIKESGAGSLVFEATNINLKDATGTDFTARFITGGDVQLYYDGSQKFATTNTGIDVTGDITLGDTNPTITFNDSSVTNLSHTILSSSDNLRLAVDVNGVDAGSRVEIFDGSTEVARFSAGAVDVTGTVTADGLTVDGNGSLLTFNNGSNPATISNTNGNITTDFDTTNAGRNYTIQANSINAFRIATGGDISFYEDTGTTAKFFWDASAESLEIGSIESSTNFPLAVKSGTNDHAISIEEASGAESWQFGVDVDGDLGFYNSGSATASVAFEDDGNATFAGTISSGAITSTGAIQGASFSDGTISGITFIDEDSFATNSATRVPTQQSIKAYVDAQVAGVVDSAPAALDTLNELAAALGDDANFSTTTSTALGNRLRVDTASQGLTGTQQANAITNLGITATKAELNYVDGVTSNIQTQLNTKITSSDNITGTSGGLSGTPNITVGSITSSGDIKNGSYTRILTGDSNTGQITFNADYASGAYTPDYNGAAQAGMSVIKMKAGGYGGLEFYVKNHGTATGTHALNTFTKVAEMHQDGYFDVPNTFKIGGTTVTSTAAELNVLDGYTGSVTELNYLDTLHATGVTSTEFDYLDGVTSNIQTQLDGKQPSGSYLTGNQTITLSGDVSGSGTTSINVTVADDSHNHVISNVDGLQTALDAKLTSSSGLNASNLTSGTVPVARLAATVYPGSATELGSGTDLNDLNGSSAGFYYQTANADTTGNNYPEGTAGSLIVQKSAGNATQLYQTYQSDVPKLYFRSNYTTGWGSWQRVFADNYHPNADTWTTARTITLGGDLSGNVSINGSANVTLTATVADDSHNHVISNVDGLQTALDAKLASSSYTASDVLTKIKTVDGAGSGLDADLLDAQEGSYYLNYNNFTNTPTIPSLSGYATETYVNTQVSNLVDSAPSTLDTLNELAAALGDDANFSTTVTNSIATKLPLAGGTLTGSLRAQADLNYFGLASGNNEGEIIINTGEGGSPQIGFTDHGDASWAIGIDDADNSFKMHGTANSTIPTINNLAIPLFEITTTAGTAYLNNSRIFTDAYHPNADTLTTARTISLTGAVTGSVSFNGSSNVSIATTATADPTLTLSGDASGSATFTNLGNATLSVTVADDSHNHVISNVDGLQTALDAKLTSSSGLNASNLTSGTVPSARLATGGSGDWWSGNVVKVGTDGVAEVGKYIDFHNTDTGSADFDTRLYSSGTDQLTINGSGRIFTDGYHPNADTWTTARTITLGGDLTGNVSIDGSANVTLTATVADDSHNHIISNVDGLQTALDGKLSTSGTAANSQLLDSLDSTAFLRSDTTDTASGVITFSDRVNLHEIRTNTGQEVIINAGESADYATGQTGEYLYVNADTGFEVNVSPDNWSSAWAGRKTLTYDGTNGLVISGGFSVDINGNLSATTKSFDIPHPSKEGMRLRHGVLEGPENGVYVRGKSQEKVILLPDYWPDLIHEDSITVQLTAIGGGQNLYVEKIEDNKVYVNGENYFYYIQAERKDVERFEVEYEV